MDFKWSDLLKNMFYQKCILWRYCMYFCIWVEKETIWYFRHSKGCGRGKAMHWHYTAF